MRDKLLEERKKLTDSIFWGLPWNQKKVKEIDDKLYTVDQLMYTLAKLRMHEDYPYRNRVETDELLERLHDDMYRTKLDD